MAAANRNKTKSQMRESAPGQHASSGAYGTRDSNQNYNSDQRQSAQTALGTHGMGALQG